MLGKYLADPEGIEGESGRFQGLGMLPIQTVITGHKVARQRQVTSNFPQAGLPVSGYEIHQGRSRVVESPNTQPDYHPLFDDAGLGMVDNGLSVWGAYLHGLFDNGPWRRAWLNRLRQQRGLKSFRRALLTTVKSEISC
jgi:adenosylcobyric acid synthase